MARPFAMGRVGGSERTGGTEDRARGNGHVILLDLMMPEMDGFEVVAALQKDTGWQDIPVIVITSLDLTAIDRERLNSGVKSVLVKDKFRPEDLVERIRRLVQSRPAATNQMEGVS